MTAAANELQQVVLTVAGSDPSGGAGIQADLKTFTVLGVYGGAVISSLTVQNTLGVYGVYPVDPELVRDQIVHVLRDLNVSHVKIGMLGSGAVAESVHAALKDFSGEIIYDPVLVSSSGRQLIEAKGIKTVREKLLSLCTVLTPNIPELCFLAEKDCTSRKLLLKAADNLLQQYPHLRSVIITGGHGDRKENIVTDHLLTRTVTGKKPAHHEFSHARIASSNTHGTGCTFSAAFTAYHLLTGNDTEAFDRATAYLARVIEQSSEVRIGHGTGPLLHHLE